MGVELHNVVPDKPAYADEYSLLEKFKFATMPRFVDHLLALPKDDVEFDRLPFSAREVEL